MGVDFPIPQRSVHHYRGYAEQGGVAGDALIYEVPGKCKWRWLFLSLRYCVRVNYNPTGDGG